MYEFVWIWVRVCIHLHACLTLYLLPTSSTYFLCWSLIGVRTSPFKFAKNTQIRSFKLFHTNCLTVAKYVRSHVWTHVEKKRFLFSILRTASLFLNLIAFPCDFHLLCFASNPQLVVCLHFICFPHNFTYR